MSVEPPVRPPVKPADDVATQAQGKAVEITAPTHGASVASVRPRLKGLATPNADVEVFIDSSPVGQATTANRKGRWRVRPTADLTPGPHRVIAVADGQESTKHCFLVYHVRTFRRNLLTGVYILAGMVGVIAGSRADVGEDPGVTPSVEALVAPLADVRWLSLVTTGFVVYWVVARAFVGLLESFGRPDDRKKAAALKEAVAQVGFVPPMAAAWYVLVVLVRSIGSDVWFVVLGVVLAVAGALMLACSRGRDV